MTEQAPQRPRRARNVDAEAPASLNISPRLAEQRAKRMERGPNDLSTNLKLSVDDSKLDHKNFVYRFANEEEGGARVRYLTEQKDYEIVSNADLAEPTEDLGNAVTRTIGSLKDGSAHRAVLLRKPREWYEADKSQDRKRDKTAMDAVRSGSPLAKSEGGHVLSAQDPHVFIPDEGISVSTPRVGGFEP